MIHISGFPDAGATARFISRIAKSWPPTSGTPRAVPFHNSPDIANHGTQIIATTGIQEEWVELLLSAMRRVS